MTKRLPLIIAIIIALTLGVAGAGKLLYPEPSSSNFHFLVAVFELLLAPLLIVCYRRFEIWLFMAGVFALWGGYALFWQIQELPCSCMGEKILLPHGATCYIDSVFFVLSLVMAYLLKAGWKKIVGLLVISPLLVLGGYLYAEKRIQALEVAGSAPERSSSGTRMIV